MRLLRLTIIAILSIFTITTLYAQDVKQIKVDTLYTFTPISSNEQFFAQFTGNKDDVVYLLADYEEFVIGSIELDIRDSVGRTVGLRDDYSLDPFVLAVLPSSGTYTVVITAEEPEPVVFWVGKSGFLEDGIRIEVTDDEKFPTFVAVRADQTAKFIFYYGREEGDLAVEVNLISFSEIFTDTVISFEGSNINELYAVVDIIKDNIYVAVVSRDLFSFSGGTSSTVVVTMDLKDD